MYNQNRPLTKFRVTSPSFNASVPVFSAMHGGKIVAQLQPGTLVNGALADSNWVMIELLFGQYGYVAKVSLEPYVASSTELMKANKDYEDQYLAPQMKESTLNRAPVSALAILLSILGVTGLVAGLFMVSFYEKTCFGLLGCGEAEYPLQSAGVVVLIASIISLICGIAISRRLRQTYR